MEHHYPPPLYSGLGTPPFFKMAGSTAEVHVYWKGLNLLFVTIGHLRTHQRVDTRVLKACRDCGTRPLLQASDLTSRLWVDISGRSRNIHKWGPIHCLKGVCLQSCLSDSKYKQPIFSPKSGGRLHLLQVIAGNQKKTKSDHNSIPQSPLG